MAKTEAQQQFLNTVWHGIHEKGRTDVALAMVKQSIQDELARLKSLDQPAQHDQINADYFPFF